MRTTNKLQFEKYLKAMPQLQNKGVAMIKKGDNTPLKERIAVEKDILDTVNNSTEPIFLKEVDTGEKYFADVEPEFRFWLGDGRVIKNLNELAHALRTMHNSTFFHHVNRDKNDFSNWIKEIIKDKALAEKVRNIKDSGEMAATIEARRLELKRKKKQLQQKSLAEKIEIEKAIEKIKEPESTLERAVAKIKTEKPLIKPIENIIQQATKKETEKPSVDEIKKPTNTISTLRKEYKESETLRKLSNLREMVGLPPLLQKKEDTKQIKKDEEKKTSKLTIKSQKIRESPEMSSLREKERALAEKEQFINQEEARLNEKRIKLSKMRVEIAQQRNQLEREKFDNFMKRKGKIEEKIIADIEKRNDIEIELPIEKEANLSDMSEIEDSLTQARSLLRQGNNELAHTKISQIKNSLASMLIPPQDRRRIEYALMELEADAKLATL